MTSSCPYCGAALKLKFCVVCGRQSKQNKMGQLRSGGRSHDATTRLEEPFIQEESGLNKNLRFRTSLKSYLMAALGGIMAGILLFCAAKEAINLYTTGSIPKIVLPWMKTHHISFPSNWPGQGFLSNKANQKNAKSSKHIINPPKKRPISKADN